jgi:hypothetical protein
MKRLLISVLLAACSHSKTTVDSTRAADATPVRTVMVFTNMPDAPFAGAMNMGFESGFRAGLAECGVNTEFRAVVEDGGDFVTRSEAQMEAMQTNAALTITEAGGKTTAYKHRDSREISAQSFDVWVQLRLFDRRINKRTWEALVHYDGFENGEVTMHDGEAFARLVAKRLRTDGMLTGCAN